MVEGAEKSKVLVVEDERDIATLMSVHLKREGYDVVEVDNGEAALGCLASGAYQLVVLDWMLPGLSGLEVCKKVRGGNGVRYASARSPILMVTARTEPAEIVLGLEMGADDYLSKPFDLSVFMARVRALLRRSTAVGEELETLKAGHLVVNTAQYLVKCGKEELSLTPSEFKLLTALMKNHGRVLTRERLIAQIQGENINVTDRTVDTHVFGLRKKLGKCAGVIETIRGIGYRVNSKGE